MLVILCYFFFSLTKYIPLGYFVLQGIVIGTGENSEFGEVFKMMQAEEVDILQIWANCNKHLNVRSIGD